MNRCTFVASGVVVKSEFLAKATEHPSAVSLLAARWLHVYLKAVESPGEGSALSSTRVSMMRSYVKMRWTKRRSIRGDVQLFNNLFRFSRLFRLSTNFLCIFSAICS
jgi:hypothetical protein